MHHHYPDHISDYITKSNIDYIIKLLSGDYMSKKHYIIIAESLKSNKAPFQLCSDLAVQFKNDNRLFDINRFLTACGH